MEVCVLGPLQVLRGGRPVALGGHRQRVVLGVLVAHANEVLTTDRLIDAVWGDEPPASARKSLQVYVSRLRKLLGDDAIEALGGGYVLRLDPDELDADRFTRLAADGHELVSCDPAGAALRLREALGLWHGMPWSDIGDEPALRPAVEHLRELRLVAVEDRIDADLALGRAGPVIAELEGLVEQHPLRERLRALLMLALYRDGRQAAALRVYDDVRRLLAEELGIDPTPELQELERRILQQDPTLEAPVIAMPSPERSPRNPYKGLRAFDETDAADFFGREAIVEELARRVAVERFVALVGPSGSGKSSVAHAGLVAAARSGAVPGSDDWIIAQMMPGTHPFEALEAALTSSVHESGSPAGVARRGDDLDLLRLVLCVRGGERSRLLLLIDQFEELFVLVEDEHERAGFVRNLVEAVEDPHSGLTVVVTMRADFYDRPLQYPELAALFVDGQVSLLPITAPEIELAAVRPAEAVGVAIEPELVAELIGEVAQQPAVLPLFQFVLTEMFEERHEDVLTIDRYRQLGGLQGALRRRGEELYAGLEPGQRAAARQVFLRLVTLGEGTEDTRRRVARAELESLAIGRAAVATVLETFGRARLLTFDRHPLTNEPTVEVAHEALLRKWPRLQEWISGAREELRLHRSLLVELREWESADRDPDYLLTGNRLGLYDDWRTTTSMSLTDAELEFVAESVRRRYEEETTELARQEHERHLERRALTRLRALVAFLAVAALAGAALTAFALDRSNEAGRQRSRAERETEAAELARDEAVVAAQVIRVKELTAASVANSGIDPELGLLLALHAVNISDITGQAVPAETIAALHVSLQAARVTYPVADAPTAVLAGPDGPLGIFRLDPVEVVGLARRHVGRELTPAECDDYFAADVCPSLPDAFPSTLTVERPVSIAASEERPLTGTRVAMWGTQAGIEGAAIRAEMDRFAERTGIEVEYQAIEDLLGQLDQTPAAELPFDLAIVPQPAVVAELARRGSLVDLGAFLDVDALRDDQSPGLVSLGTVARGTTSGAATDLYGVAVEIDPKSLVWYPVPQFSDAGYEVPRSWDELVALTEQMVADGRTPWCHGEGSGFSSGWPGTDWIEDLVLHDAGPAAYDRWVTHELTFDDPAIRDAFERFASLVLADGHVYGGQRTAATMPFQVAQHPMFDDPPGCWLYRFHHAAQNFLPLGREPGRDVAFFPFPAIDDDHRDAMLGGGTFVVAFTDRPEVREVVRYMTSPDYGYEASELSPEFVSPNRRFPVEQYPNELTRELAEVTTRALERDAFRFDASDLMPVEVGDVVFWPAMVDFTGAGPANLDEIAGRLETAWDAATASGNG